MSLDVPKSSSYVPPSWSEAAAPVWALVCGLPDAIRRRRILVFLTGFIDESYDAAVFVMAGYAAPAEEWAAFSDKWAATCDADRAFFGPLKMSEAMGLNGAFFRWTEDERDAKLRALYAVIDEHVSFELSVVIPMAPFKRIFGDGSLPRRRQTRISTLCRCLSPGLRVIRTRLA